MVGQQLSSASEYLEKEVGEAAKCQDLFQRIQTYEKVHPVSFKVPLYTPPSRITYRRTSTSGTKKSTDNLPA
jgi:hypothetical protein